MAVAATLAFAAPATAATRYVDAGGADSPDCTFALTPCATIGFAIAQASDGDVVQVAAGNYPEHVIVDKRVHLVGAQAGIDARTRAVATTGESVVVGGFEFQKTASTDPTGASVDGFFADGDIGAADTHGFDLTPAASGYRVVNNIVRNFTAGVVVGTNGLSHTVIRHNQILQNNQPPFGPPSGGIGDQVHAEDVEIDANSLSDNAQGSIRFLSDYSSRISVTNNSTIGSNAVILGNLHDSVLSGNTFHGGVLLEGGNTDVGLSGNTITQVPGAALTLVNFNGTNRGISVVGNDLSNNSGGIVVSPDAGAATLHVHFNRIVANGGGDGVANNDTPAVDATNNWWGCNAGPTVNPSQPPQPPCAMNSVGVVFAPWLVFGVTAERGRVLTNGDTNPITAGFTFNSNAQAVDPSPFPATPVTFPAAALGTVSPASATTSGGIANTLYTAGGTAGQGNVTASADGQNVTTSNFEVSSEAGPQGLPGTNGANGATGAQGSPGTNGTNGTNGQDGATGPQGPPGPQGAEGPAGPSTPASPREPNPVLILSNSLRATKQRIVAVSITCPVAAGLCDGRLGIGVGRSTLGNTSFLVNGGNRAVIRLRGSAATIRAAIKKKKVTVVVLSRDNAGTAALTSKIVKFRK